MNGLVVVNKEIGYTSFDIVAIAKKAFKTSRIGHLGTLDPLASGVLVLCIDQATKLVPFLENHDKEYIARVTIGKSTKTYDLEGEVIDTKKVLINQFTEDEIDNLLKTFLGKQLQVPPMFSAIKINGEKMYNLARKDINVDIPPREIEIKSIERISNLVYENDECSFEIKCLVSKGTYIRSLCFDIGKKIGYPSVMSKLIRTKSGCFNIDDANVLSINDLKTGNIQESNIISMLDSLKDYPIIEAGKYKTFISNGVKLTKEEVNNNTDSKIVIFKDGKELLAIYEYDEENNLYKALRIWK